MTRGKAKAKNICPYAECKCFEFATLKIPYCFERYVLEGYGSVRTTLVLSYYKLSLCEINYELGYFNL